MVLGHRSAATAAREVKGLKRPAPASPPPPDIAGNAAKTGGKKICMPFVMHLSGVITSVESLFKDCNKPVGSCPFSHASISTCRKDAVLKEFNDHYTKLSAPVKAACVKYITDNAKP